MNLEFEVRELPNTAKLAYFVIHSPAVCLRFKVTRSQTRDERHELKFVISMDPCNRFKKCSNPLKSIAMA